MFLFSNPSYAHRLYGFSRCLAEFRSEAVLKDLPLRFLTQRSARQVMPNLPEEPEKRLTHFLIRYGIPEQTLAAYLALYPDITGNELSELLFRSVWTLPDFPKQAEETDRKRAFELLKLFYALCLCQKTSKQLAEQFENLLDREFDFRLEGSILERLHDSFYEDGTVRAVLPDWPSTTKNRLVLQEPAHLLPLRDSPNKQKTAGALVRAAVCMLLRDGLTLIPSNAACRTDNEGNLYFIRARMPLLLADKERMFISSFAQAIHSKKYQAAAGTLLTAGYATGSAVPLTRLIEAIEKKESPSPAQKAEILLNGLHSNGMPLPFFMRYCVQVLKTTEHLCRKELGLDRDFWKAAETDFSDFLLKGKEILPFFQETAAQFRQAFSFSPYQKERLMMQNRKLPAFQKDAGKLSEILSRQTISAQFQPKRRKLWPLILSLTITGALIGWGLY